MGWAMLFLHDCDSCGFAEERVFTDSYTAMTLCMGCLGKVMDETTNSPASEGDNLRTLLRAALGEDYVPSQKP